jgi:hypothetical protein
MVHRSLTPANVLYRRLDHLYKLADLSLARALALGQVHHSRSGNHPTEFTYRLNRKMPPVRVVANPPSGGICVSLLLNTSPTLAMRGVCSSG